MIEQININSPLSSKFSKPFSLRSNRFENPTPKMANAIFGSPARHPEKDRIIGVDRVKNGIEKYTVERKRRSAWDATAPNERFGKMAALTPQKVQYEFVTSYPAASLVEAATSPSRHHVRRQRGTAQRET